MGIALSEEQVALAESVAKFVARHAPTATTRLDLDDLAYAKVREQFGQTIGSFQAIKHKCARLLVELELMTASWHGPEAATTAGPGGAAAQAYLSCPPVLIGGGIAEIQLNVIGERVLGLARG